MIGVGPECSQEEVRAMLAVRLNGFLCGHTGVSEEIVEYYLEFINRGIHPIVKNAVLSGRPISAHCRGLDL